MEANELMIGDWVCYSKPNNYCTKVKEIKCTHSFPDDVIYYIEGQRDNRDRLKNECDESFVVDIISPIPLTKEILEKNGWVYNNEDEKFYPETWVGGGLMLQGADDCGYCIVVTSNYDDEDTNDTPFIILYVHELQHVLMLRRIKREIIL